MKPFNSINSMAVMVRSNVGDKFLSRTSLDTQVLPKRPGLCPGPRVIYPYDNRKPLLSRSPEKRRDALVPNTTVKDLVVVKDVDLKALVPLKNVYGGEPEEPVSPIPVEIAAQKGGTFKYITTKHKDSNELGLLLASNISAAHAALLKIAEKSGKYAVMAGHVTIHEPEKGKNSRLCHYTNTSGHLQPKGTYEQQQVTETAFASKGLDAQGKYRPKQWHPVLGRYIGQTIGPSGAGIEIRV